VKTKGDGSSGVIQMIDNLANDKGQADAVGTLAETNEQIRT